MSKHVRFLWQTPLRLSPRRRFYSSSFLTSSNRLSTSLLETSRCGIHPNPTPFRSLTSCPTTQTTTAKRKEIFNTPIEKCTDDIVQSLQVFELAPIDNTTTSVNPNAKVFVIGDEFVANAFIAAVMRVWQLWGQVGLEENFVVVGFDVEFASNGAPAIVQIAFASNLVAIFQLNNGQLPGLLKDLITSTNVRKSGVGILNDGSKIQDKFGIVPQAFVDCEFIAKAATIGARSLVSLYHIYVGSDLPFKKPGSQTGHDWSQANLSPEAIEYAANDALASLLVHRAMINLPESNVSPWDSTRPFFGQFSGRIYSKLPRSSIRSVPAAESYSLLVTPVCPVDVKQPLETEPTTAISLPLETITPVVPPADIQIEPTSPIPPLIVSDSQLTEEPTSLPSNQVDPASANQLPSEQSSPMNLNLQLSQKAVEDTTTQLRILWNSTNRLPRPEKHSKKHPVVTQEIEERLFNAIAPKIEVDNANSRFKIFHLAKLARKSLGKTIHPSASVMSQFVLEVIALWIVKGRIVDFDNSPEPTGQLANPPPITANISCSAENSQSEVLQPTIAPVSSSAELAKHNVSAELQPQILLESNTQVLDTDGNSAPARHESIDSPATSEITSTIVAEEKVATKQNEKLPSQDKGLSKPDDKRVVGPFQTALVLFFVLALSYYFV
ncbi:hypothetical protein BDR26DRAFT_922698 [Obelidium mucronatum]|nr:hypothetical protein BDR26DRAFT_922698 [Obelidium mucronatum]